MGHAWSYLHPGRRECERLLQALALRDNHRAVPLQGPARTPAPAGRPCCRRQRFAAVGRGRRRLGDPRGGSLEEVEGVLALFRKNVGSTLWSLAELPFLSTNTVADNRALLVPFETSSCLKGRSNGAGRVPWLFESQNCSVLEER